MRGTIRIVNAAWLSRAPAERRFPPCKRTCRTYSISAAHHDSCYSSFADGRTEPAEDLFNGFDCLALIHGKQGLKGRRCEPADDDASGQRAQVKAADDEERPTQTNDGLPKRSQFLCNHNHSLPPSLKQNGKKVTQTREPVEYQDRRRAPKR